MTERKLDPVGDYAITEGGGVYTATLTGELSKIEQQFGIKTVICAGSLDELIVLVGWQMGRRELLGRAVELAAKRIADGIPYEE